MSRRTHCRYGHELNARTTLVQTKLHHASGAWYVVRSCRVCRSIEASIRWYAGKHASHGGHYRHRGVPPTVEEIARRAERRWVRRMKHHEG